MPYANLSRLQRLADTSPGAITTERGEVWRPKNELGDAAVEIATLREAILAPPDDERTSIGLFGVLCLMVADALAAFYLPFWPMLGLFVFTTAAMLVVCYLVPPRNRGAERVAK